MQFYQDDPLDEVDKLTNLPETRGTLIQIVALNLWVQVDDLGRNLQVPSPLNQGSVCSTCRRCLRPLRCQGMSMTSKTNMSKLHKEHDSLQTRIVKYFTNDKWILF